MVKRIFMILLICLIGVFSLCYANTITYFYSDTAAIGYNSCAIYDQCVDGFTSTDFSTYFSYAKSQWGAAGLAYGSALNAYSGTIEFYGGTEATLAASEPLIVDYWALTVNEQYTYERTDTYQGTNIQVYYLDKVKVYCPKQPLTTASGFKNMFTHELGHACGWLGHSSSSSDVMCVTPSGSRISLTSRDKDHLSQMY